MVSNPICHHARLGRNRRNHWLNRRHFGQNRADFAAVDFDSGISDLFRAQSYRLHAASRRSECGRSVGLNPAVCRRAETAVQRSDPPQFVQQIPVLHRPDDGACPVVCRVGRRAVFRHMGADQRGRRPAVYPDDYVPVRVWRDYRRLGIQLQIRHARRNACFGANHFLRNRHVRRAGVRDYGFRQPEF